MKRRNLISMLIAMVLCLSFMTTTGLAETLINELNIVTNINEVIKSGANVQDINITATAPEHKDLKFTANFKAWYTPVKDSSSSMPVVFTGPKFIDGDTYFYLITISVEDTSYKFAKNLKLNQDGFENEYPLDEEGKNSIVLDSPPYKATPSGPKVNIAGLDEEEPGEEEPGGEEPGGEDPSEPGEEEPGDPDPEPETPVEPEEPETPETPDPYYPGYYDDWYDWYEPSEPSQTKVDQAKKDEKPEEKAEEKTEEKPEAIERKVILTIGSKGLENQVDGVASHTEMDVAAYAKDGRTMLPIRFVAEALGMSVTWDAKTRTVIIEDMLFKVEIPIDTNKIIVNGETYISDVKPEIVDGRTMMPIANIARALGLKDGEEILWDQATKQVTIIRTISR